MNIGRAADQVKFLAWLFLLGAVIGLFVAPVPGVLAGAGSGGLFLLARLIRDRQSRVAAGVVLVVALAIFVVRLVSNPTDHRFAHPTAFLVLASWVYIGGYALAATVNYHRVGGKVSEVKP